MWLHLRGTTPRLGSNIVPVIKKNEKIRVCTYIRDFNTACPKNEFLLPITDVMIDNTCGFKRMSFMDNFSVKSRCTQRWEAYIIHNAIGVYYYTIMPFELKNTGATYQRAMSTTIHDHLGKWWNAMLTTLPWKVAAEATISITWELCSTSCGLTS